jgi:glycosyltransferase involved in cell wall biosynthesis
VQYLEKRQITYEIIVSADGTDGTQEIVAELSKTNPRIQGIGSPERCGKGRGIRNAVALATGMWIGFSDADNKTPITEFEKFIPFLEQGTEVVIGSRGSRDDGDSRLQLLRGNIRNVRDVISIRFRNYSPPATKVSQEKILTP